VDADGFPDTVTSVDGCPAAPLGTPLKLVITPAGSVWKMSIPFAIQPDFAEPSGFVKALRTSPKIARWKLTRIQHHRELCRQILEAKLTNFPVFFPVSRELGLENGSLETLSTAIESLKSEIYCRLSSQSRDFGQILGSLRRKGAGENSLFARVARNSHQFSKREFGGSF